MPKRSVPEVNAGSMADIAFLLLIFFLVTTEMTKEAGMFQLLAEKTDEPIIDSKKIKERNIIEVLVNDNDEILFENNLVQLSEIPALVKEMILNSGDNVDWPESRPVTREEIEERVVINRNKLENVAIEKKASAENSLRKAELRLEAFEIYGSDFRKSEHIINVQSTVGPKYGTYIELKDKLKQAYTQLRDELARKKLGRGWDDLKLVEKEMLKMVFDENITEAPIVK